MKLHSISVITLNLVVVATTFMLEAKSTLFTRYSDIPRSVEATYLNGYSRKLQSEDTAGGCIITYGGRSSNADEAERLANRAKNYIVNVRGIEAGRLTFMDGGYREDPTTELWIVPQGADMPLASPTVDR